MRSSWIGFSPGTPAGAGSAAPSRANPIGSSRSATSSAPSVRSASARCRSGAYVSAMKASRSACGVNAPYASLNVLAPSAASAAPSSPRARLTRTPASRPDSESMRYPPLALDLSSSAGSCPRLPVHRRTRPGVLVARPPPLPLVVNTFNHCRDRAGRPWFATGGASMRSIALCGLVLMGLPLLGTGCARLRGASPGPRADVAAAADVPAQLMAADRAFAAAAAARGLEGWMEYIAPDAVRMGRMQNPVRGTEAIRRSDADIFADSTVRLTWEPTDAGAFDAGSGWTVGRSQVRRRAADGSEKVERTGRYITIWRRSADGRWLVALDTGAGDPAPAP